MSRSVLRSTSLCLALMSSLPVVSCSSSGSKASHNAPGAAAQVCSSCVDISVHVWKFTPDAGTDVTKLSGITQASADGKASVNMQANSKEARPAEILKKLQQSGHAELVLNFDSVTTSGQSLPLSTSGSAGEFSALMTPAALKANTPYLINYELRAAMPHGGLTGGRDAYTKGNFLLKDGGALLSMQKVGESYAVWLISTKHPV